jgi:hypothetical protein
MSPMQFDGSQHILYRSTVHAPSAQTGDLQRCLLGRQQQLSGGSEVELLQHLQTDTARTIQPETGYQFYGNPAFISGSGVEA